MCDNEMEMSSRYGIKKERNDVFKEEYSNKNHLIVISDITPAFDNRVLYNLILDTVYESSKRTFNKDFSVILSGQDINDNRNLIHLSNLTKKYGVESFILKENYSGSCYINNKGIIDFFDYNILLFSLGKRVMITYNPPSISSTKKQVYNIPDILKNDGYKRTPDQLAILGYQGINVIVDDDVINSIKGYKNKDDIIRYLDDLIPELSSSNIKDYFECAKISYINIGKKGLIGLAYENNIDVIISGKTRCLTNIELRFEDNSKIMVYNSGYLSLDKKYLYFSVVELGNDVSVKKRQLILR